MSAAKPMWKYFLSTSWSPSRLALNSGNFFSAATAGLDQEGQHRHLDARLLVLLVGRDAERLELGDVGVVVVGDVRDHHPVAVQVGAADLLDARQLLALDRAELGEVDLAATAAGPRPPPPPRCRRLGRLRLGAGRAAHHGLDEVLHVLLRDAALGPAALDLVERHAEFARELAHRGRGVRHAPAGRGRLVRRQRPRPSTPALRQTPADAAARQPAGVGGRRAAAAAAAPAQPAPRPPRLRAVAIRLPLETLSPTLTLSSFTHAGRATTGSPSTPCRSRP